MLENIYNSYLTGDERLEAIAEAKQDALLNKLCTMYEMVDMNLQLNLRDAEIKVFEESGTYDDLQFLYEEAQQEAQQQKEGIFSKIIGVIQSLINTILNGIRSFFGKSKEQNPNDTVEIDSALIEEHNSALKWWEKIKNLFSDVTSNKATMIKIVGGAAIATSTIVGVKMIKRSEADGMVGHLRDIIQKVENGIKTATSAIGTKAKNAKGIVAEGLKWFLNNIIVDGLKKLKDLVNKIAVKIGYGSIFSNKDIKNTGKTKKPRNKFGRGKNNKNQGNNQPVNNNNQQQPVNNNQPNNNQPVNNNQANNNNNQPQNINASVDDTMDLLGFNIFSESENEYFENENADDEIKELSDLFSDL